VSALWLLIRLQVRGWLRFLGRSLGTVQGALLGLVGGSVVLLWLASVLLVRSPAAASPEMLRRYGAAWLIGYCLVNVLLSNERAIYFTPAEVNFLFAGPFGRRQLLGYKVLYTFLLGLPTALLMACFMHVYAHSFLAAYLAMLLAVLFMQLFAMVLSLLGTALGARLWSLGRRLLLGAVVLAVAAVGLTAAGSPAEWDLRGSFERLIDTRAWQVGSAPLRWFFDVLTASNGRELLESSFLALLVDVALLGVVFVLDADYLEASAAASARIYARIQRLRRGGLASEGLRGSGTARLRLPMLPYWGGVGPVLWRQLTTALRGLGRLALLLVILAVTLVVPLVTAGEETEAVLPVMAGLVLWLTMFLSSVLPFDFRSDLDRMAFLKTLPLPSWRLVLGQLLAPVLLLTGVQWLMVAVVLLLTESTRGPMLACAAYAPVFNFLLFALDNLLFLLFPSRLPGASPGDFQALGRGVLTMLAKGLVLLVVGLGAGLVGLVVGLATGSVTAGVAAAWPIVAACAVALVPLVAWAFRAFDVARSSES
jgi:hypothetical protein